MESLLLFTGLLLAVCTLHLIFTAVEAIERWVARNRSRMEQSARSGREIRRSDWYVFFNPEDLIGKERKASNGKQTGNSKNTDRQAERRRNSRRMAARTAA